LAPLDRGSRAGARLLQALPRRPPRGLASRCLRPPRCFARHPSPILRRMAPDNDPISEPTIFSAVLTPHRSLGPTGFLIFMAVLGGMSFVSGMVFLIAGAWPVFGFFGLDVLLVYWAFRANYRSARAYEVVTVT